MEDTMESFILRKITTTFVVTTLLSLLFALIYGFSDSFEFAYNQGNQFIGWFFIYFIYIGVIVLIYGSLVSVAMEYAQKTWYRQHNWIYVLLLGIFGLANGLFFQEVSLLYPGCWLRCYME